MRGRQGRRLRFLREVSLGLRAARFTAASIVALLLLTAPPASAWGPVAHALVTSRAIDTLPGGLKPFYKNHRLEIPTLSLEGPPTTDESLDRRFAVDRLLPFPFADLPRTEEALKARFADQASVGRLPWLIAESYARLIEAFKSTDKTRILTESDTLAGLVAELRNPLALADNADGQKTGQHGLWVRFTVKLPEAMDGRLKLDPEAARYLDDPREYVFSVLNSSYVWLDNLLYLEDLARRGKSGYTQIYYESLELRAGGLLRARLSEAATDVGSYWYTAWTAAGRPTLK
jgi:hypothetical protein